MREENYEVHIVGFNKANLDEGVPKHFFTNQVIKSTQGFSEIATSEISIIKEAYKQFEIADKWSKEIFSKQQTLGVHVKLESVCEQIQIAKNSFQQSSFVARDHGFDYTESPIVPAWDIHLDGTIDETLKKLLHEDGFIILDYLSSSKKEMSSLTMHFLQPEDCKNEFDRVCKLINNTGGFSGNIYYEHPLIFTVYGKTIPRPIVLSQK